MKNPKPMTDDRAKNLSDRDVLNPLDDGTLHLFEAEKSTRLEDTQLASIQQLLETSPPSQGSGVPEPPLSASHSFDLSNFRLDQSFLQESGVKKQLLRVPVQKPSRQHFVWVFNIAGWQINVSLINLKEDREFYLLEPGIALLCPGECSPHTLVCYAVRHGGIGVWPIRLPAEEGKDNPWWQTAREIVTLHAGKWVRVIPNMMIGGYDLHEAVGNLEPPPKPEKSFAEILEIAFKDKIIRNEDHPVLRKLRGEI